MKSMCEDAPSGDGGTMQSKVEIQIPSVESESRSVSTSPLQRGNTIITKFGKRLRRICTELRNVKNEKHVQKPPLGPPGRPVGRGMGAADHTLCRPGVQVYHSSVPSPDEAMPGSYSRTSGFDTNKGE